MLNAYTIQQHTDTVLVYDFCMIQSTDDYRVQL